MQNKSNRVDLRSTHGAGTSNLTFEIANPRAGCTLASSFLIDHRLRFVAFVSANQFVANSLMQAFIAIASDVLADDVMEGNSNFRGVSHGPVHRLQ